MRTEALRVNPRIKGGEAVVVSCTRAWLACFVRGSFSKGQYKVENKLRMAQHSEDLMMGGVQRWQDDQ